VSANPQTPLALAVPDDATLVAQAVAGNERAFTLLYRRHARYVAGVVYRLLGSDADLDDVMQETFCDAAAALGSLREPSRPRPWLARIAVHRVYARLARRRRSRWLLGATTVLAPKVSDPAERERVVALYEILERLAPKVRTPWVLHVIGGESLPDVAAVCEVSLATVKRRVAEAEQAVQRGLDET